jgi:type I restriction enzyme, S subunit
MSHYKPYQEYKDSGVEWLGRVPEHWEIARFDAKTTTHRFSIDAKSLNDKQIMHYSIPTIQACGHARLEDGDTIDSNKLVIFKRQLLVSKLNPHKQTLVVADKDEDYFTVASTEFVPLIPKEADLSYITYVWMSGYCLDYMIARCESSTRSHQRVSPDDITKMRWVWPTVNEQQSIVIHLDRETGRIDGLISKKTHFIELLSEKRQALIAQAVTKGIDPNVKMKDSGMELLGFVPECWEVTPLKWLAVIHNGKDYKDGEVDEGGYPVIGSGGEFKRASQYLFNGESVLLGRKGTIDRPLYINGPFWTVDTMYYTVIGPKSVGKYLYYCSLNIQFDRYSTSTALPSMTQEVLGQIKFAVPAIQEQKRIVAYLDSETTRIDNLISKTESSISLLKERRSALITAAVTGQIDLREAA